MAFTVTDSEWIRANSLADRFKQLLNELRAAKTKEQKESAKTALEGLEKTVQAEYPDSKPPLFIDYKTGVLFLKANKTYIGKDSALTQGIPELEHPFIVVADLRIALGRSDELGTFLGQGTSGQVFVGQTQLKEKVAVKIETAKQGRVVENPLEARILRARGDTFSIDTLVAPDILSKPAATVRVMRFIPGVTLSTWYHGAPPKGLQLLRQLNIPEYTWHWFLKNEYTTCDGLLKLFELGLGVTIDERHVVQSGAAASADAKQRVCVFMQCAATEAEKIERERKRVAAEKKIKTECVQVISLSTLLENIKHKKEESKRQPPSPKKILQVALAIAQELDKLHNLKDDVEPRMTGVIHRDLKGENLHVDDSTDPPTVTLLDFGSSGLKEEEATHLFRTTPDHAAPELLVGAQQALLDMLEKNHPDVVVEALRIRKTRIAMKNATPPCHYTIATDVYALGVTLRDELGLSPKQFPIVAQCLDLNPDERPLMEKVISELTKLAHTPPESLKIPERRTRGVPKSAKMGSRDDGGGAAAAGGSKDEHFIEERVAAGRDAEETEFNNMIFSLQAGRLIEKNAARRLVDWVKTQLQPGGADAADDKARIEFSKISFEQPVFVKNALGITETNPWTLIKYLVEQIEHSPKKAGNILGALVDKDLSALWEAVRSQSSSLPVFLQPKQTRGEQILLALKVPPAPEKVQGMAPRPL